MTSDHYLDIRLLGADSSDLNLPAIANRVMHVLHGAFRQAQGQYALALPSCKPDRRCSIGDKLRVFGSESALAELLDRTRDHFVFRDYCQVSSIAKTPDDYTGPWIRYRRYRVSNRNAERKPDGDLRERGMESASSRGLPYFQVRSASNGKGFSLFVEVESSSAELGPIEPDGYGLSTTSRPFSLPDLPFG